MAEMAKVWVVNYEHRHGNDLTVHATEAGARRHAASIVAEWYEQELDPEFDAETVETIRAALALGTEEGDSAAISAYNDSDPEEWVNVSEHTLLP